MPAFTTAIATVWLGCAAIIPGCTVAAITPNEAPPTTSALPACDASYGGSMPDGTVIVTVEHNGEFPACDMLPGMRLDLVWNERTEGEGWGGDASVANAEQEAHDAGCKELHWYNDGGYRLIGAYCDF